MGVFGEITEVWGQWGGQAWAWLANTSPGAYLLGDATGQRVLLGLGLALMLVSGWVAVRFGRLLVHRCRHVPTVLLIALGAYYASVLLLRLDASQWAPAAAVAAVTLLVVGLVMAAASHAGARRKKVSSRSAKNARLATV